MYIECEVELLVEISLRSAACNGNNVNEKRSKQQCNLFKMQVEHYADKQEYKHWMKKTI